MLTTDQILQSIINSWGIVTGLFLFFFLIVGVIKFFKKISGWDN